MDEQHATRDELTRFRPLEPGRNPNRHTAQGLAQLAAAIDRHGYVAPMTAAANGDVIDGNARLGTSAEKFGDVAPIVVEHDGTRPVIMVRTDIADARDPRALDIIVSANRVPDVNLLFDPAVLKSFEGEGLDLKPYEFGPLIEHLVGQNNARDEWAGMPEYENENQRPVHAVRVNFATVADMHAFAAFIGQTLTEKTVSVWWPAKVKGERAPTETGYVQGAEQQ
jgi:hypothetical protein